MTTDYRVILEFEASTLVKRKVPGGLAIRIIHDYADYIGIWRGSVSDRPN